MNPITQTRNLMAINDRELDMGIAGTKNSWHQEYKDSAWVFMGGMPYQLTEGDIICMFSQYGEVVHINLIRDHTSGKSKGFGFLCYEDQRSTILAVDNLNGFKLLGKMIRVDHIHQYKLPKDLEKLDQDRKKLFMEGVAPKLVSEPDSSSEEELVQYKSDKKKKKKKDKKKHKKKKKKKDKMSDSDVSEEEEERKTKNDKVANGSRNGTIKDFSESRRDRERSRSNPRQEDSQGRRQKEIISPVRRARDRTPSPRRDRHAAARERRSRSRDRRRSRSRSDDRRRKRSKSNDRRRR